MGENIELGKATYDAYCEHLAINQGTVLPSWEQLSPSIRSAWIAAGEAGGQKMLQQIAPDVSEDA
jgi:hypothetical protein